MTYRELYDYGVRELTGAGIGEAALDARLLLEFICRTGRNDLLVHGEREVAKEECAAFYGCIAERKGHVPLQYITGEQEFMGLAFEVNGHVLIPRQDTEILVEEVMRFLHDGMDVLDMCTGSGCILLSLLHYSNGCRGLGADISGEALAVAERNLQRMQTEYPGGGSGTGSAEWSCRFVRSDLFENICGQFDIIVSNPPYIPTGELPGLMEEVRLHEPAGALDGGEDGLCFYRKIASQAAGYLRGGGYLFFETGCSQREAVSRIMEEEGYRDITAVKDYAGLDRVVYGWK